MHQASGALRRGRPVEWLDMRRIFSMATRLLPPVAGSLLLLGMALWNPERQAEAVPPGVPSLAAETLARQARLLPLPAAVRATAPAPATWEMPMGSRRGAGTYNAQPFGSPNPRRGGLHLGDDWNGIGQENTDLGDPVFAVADGLAVYSGIPSPGWGGVIILLHRCANGEKQSFYGHLEPDSLAVVANEFVPRGRLLGRIGLPLSVDFSHLHLEWRSGPVIDLGPGYGPPGTGNAENASQFLESRIGPPGLPVAGRAGARQARPRLAPEASAAALENRCGREKKGLPGNHGNARRATVAAFLPWRGSQAGAPWPLAAWESRTPSAVLKSIKKISN